MEAKDMKKNPYKGKFLAFEGLDGSGQTTQANLLSKYLEKQGFNVVLTKEPTLDSKAGKEIKKILNKKAEATPNHLQELFAKDRNWHQKNKIIPALKQNKIIVSDRSQFSSFAFGVASGTNLDYLFSLNDEFIMPDLVILLRTSPKTSIKRIEKRGTEKTLFEKEKQLERVWNVFEKLSKRFKNIIIVDGEKSIEEIHKKVWQIMKQIL